MTGTESTTTERTEHEPWAFVAGGAAGLIEATPEGSMDRAVLAVAIGDFRQSNVGLVVKYSTDPKMWSDPS